LDEKTPPTIKIKLEAAKSEYFYKPNMEGVQTIERQIFQEVTGMRYNPSLIVVTENILMQWKSEFNRFAPQIKLFVLEKAADFKRLDKVLNGPQFLLKANQNLHEKYERKSMEQQ
jgi:hypothetical protein